MGAYSDAENLSHWHSVVTVFFLDTAANVCAYVDLIYKILRPGAAWINFGPLLYHYDGMDNASISLPLSAVKEIIVKCGFVVCYRISHTVTGLL